VLLCQRVVRRRSAARATRDRPDALAALGKDPRRYQMVVWTFAGALTGLAGGLYAATLFYIDRRCSRSTPRSSSWSIGVGGLASTRAQCSASSCSSPSTDRCDSSVCEPVRGAAAAGNVRASLDRSHDLPATRLDG
jgi:hypothetical protein